MAATAYLTRHLEPLIRRAAREFPAVVLTGPRQCGKTTLLRHVFGRTHEYVSLDPPDVREVAQADPRGFLELHPGPVIFDEIQHAPELLSYLKARIDDARQRRGRFVLTGSQNLTLAQHVSESLAGRAGLFRLLPLSLREIDGRGAPRAAWPAARARTLGPVAHGRALWGAILAGGYPDVALHRSRDIAHWHASYVQTYLERDVRRLRQVGDLSQFQLFLRMLAARSGQLLSLSDMSRDLGVALNTAKAWIAVLEATYQIVIVRPYVANMGKRLVKTPKVYFTDTGTLCYLTGLRDANHAAAGPMAGALAETAVLGELVKHMINRGMEPRIHFWRTAKGAEVDFLVEHDRGLTAVEVKASSTPRPGMAAGIHALQRDLGSRLTRGVVVHFGAHVLPLGGGVTAMPFGDL